MIDAHHHLWDLSAVHYPWLMARGVERFFGDPTPIQKDYLFDTFKKDANRFRGSVHIQVGAESAVAEAKWIQQVADNNPDWPMGQVVFCDLTAKDLNEQLDIFQDLPTLRGVRQIVGRAPEEDAQTGTNSLLSDIRFAHGLNEVAQRGLSFDIQLIPELYEGMARTLDMAPDVKISLCHAGSPHTRSVEGLKTWSQRLKLLSERPQVSCKLSGLGMFDHNWSTESIRPIVETCLDQFGTDRCMFGSNFPVDSLYSTYGKLVNAMRSIVPDRDHTAVFNDNASNFYNLPVAPANA